MKTMRLVGGIFFVFLISVSTVQPMMRRFVPMLTRVSSGTCSRLFNKNQTFSRQVRAISDSSEVEGMLQAFKDKLDCDEEEVSSEIDFHTQKFIENVVNQWELQHRIVNRLSCSFETARRLIGHPEEKTSLLEFLAKNCACTVRVIELTLEQEQKEWNRTKKYKYLNALNDEGQTLIFSAVQNNWSAALKFLLEIGANVDIPNSQGITPLHVAAGHGNFEYLRALLNANAEPNVYYYEQDGLLPITPLRLAVEMNDVECVSELLECGASPEFPIKEYKTFLIEIARAQGNQRIVDLLNYYPIYAL